MPAYSSWTAPGLSSGNGTSLQLSSGFSVALDKVNQYQRIQLEALRAMPARDSYEKLTPDELDRMGAYMRNHRDRHKMKTEAARAGEEVPGKPVPPKAGGEEEKEATAVEWDMVQDRPYFK